MFKAIVATDSLNGIAKNGSIPWNVPEDMKFFKEKTMGSIVIMGRKTYESIGRPLPGRINCIISKNAVDNVVNNLIHGTKSDNTYSGVKLFHSPESCAKWCFYNRGNKDVWVIGGAMIYEWYMRNNYISEYFVTRIHGDYQCDTHIDLFRNQLLYRQMDELSIYHGLISNKPEVDMLDMIQNLLEKKAGCNRTGVDALSHFGFNVEFDLTSNTFPLMTTRKMFFRGIFEELMLYIRGQTDSKILEEKGVNVWKGNTSREFLDSRRLNYPVGDMGHSYGFSFRHFGAEYKTCLDNYEGQGFDQLMYVINEIKTNPESRRLIISLWEPNYLHKAALPPCLYNYQFNVDDDGLSCMMTQRSSDFMLAGGWNVATGALLTYFIAHYTGYKPYKLIWNVGNCHIYVNHFDQAVEQVARQVRQYPKLYLKNMPENIEDIQFDNINLFGYEHSGSISLPMNV